MLVAGCGSVASATDAPVRDAFTRCSPTAPFGMPALLSGKVNTSGAEYNPSLTADELGLYFSASPGTLGADDLYFATRSSIEADFGMPLDLTPINSASTDESPSITGDGRTLYLVSGRVGNADSDVYVATRGTVAADFSTVATVSTLNSAKTERATYILPDGSAIYFSRYDRANGNMEIILRAQLGTNGFSAPLPVEGLDSITSHGFPVVTPDERTIYFASTGVGTDEDIYVATRANAHDPFGAPAAVTELNAVGSQEEPGWISSDGCHLYFASNRKGSFDLYVAKRGP